MLTHELNNFTMAEAVKFYPQLKAAFSHLVPIGVALNNTQAYLEPSPIIPDFEQCGCCLLVRLGGALELCLG